MTAEPTCTSDSLRSAANSDEVMYFVKEAPMYCSELDNDVIGILN
jgi:hypothetical protein